MRIAILVRDKEYRDALVQKLFFYDNNLYVNIIENNIKDAAGCVILTDVPPTELNEKVLKVLKPRTVFITRSESESWDGCWTVFKFISIPEMISQLSDVYNRWCGTGPGLDHTARLITVCCESDAYSAYCCRTLAGQIIYTHGGSVLILPLSYINDHGVHEKLQTNSLSRDRKSVV